MAHLTPQLVTVHAGNCVLEGDLCTPTDARGLVVFVHGSGSSRLSPRNRHVADLLVESGFATLLFDLLTPEEAQRDELGGRLRFDIALLSRRVIATLDWLQQRDEVEHLPIGLFGASTGAAAAIVAAAARPELVHAIVSRGGRPDLAGEHVGRVEAPTLLIVGGRDETVLELNRSTLDALPNGQLQIVQGATHLFEERGALDKVVTLATGWFAHHLPDAAPV